MSSRVASLQDKPYYITLFVALKLTESVHTTHISDCSWHYSYTDFLYDDGFSGICFNKVLKESKNVFKFIASFISKIKDEVIKLQ